jgi:hypothetical protein
MADLAQTHANGVASDRTEWYGGATRFELELEVQHSIHPIHLLIRERCCSTSSHETCYADKNRQFVQSLSNPYYLHHLCIQKYFEDDAFLEWCKYLKYFSEPEYLPYLSYVAHHHLLVQRLIYAS